MEDLITSIVERELGETAIVVSRFEAGLIHDTYEVQFEEVEYVLQLSDANEEREDGSERGLNCYRLLQNSQIPVPTLVTKTVREFDGRKYVLVEKLPGDTGERDISPERVRDTGRYLAKVHDVWDFENAGSLRFDPELSVEAFREGSLTQWRYRNVKDSTAFLQAGGLENVGRAVERLFNRETIEFRDTFQTVLCHNDYSPDNVLFRKDEVTGIIDFDRAYAGESHRDIVKAANGFWMHDPCADRDVRETFYDGYREANELGASFKVSEPYTRVETLAITIGGMLRMNELSEYEMDFYSERILEAIDRVSQK